MDLSMPVMDGLATVRWLKEHKIPFPVLMLTLDTTDKAIVELYRAGVRGYLSKTCNAETLKRAIDDIINTGYHHNELLSNALQQNGPISQKDEREKIMNQLTDRELEFLRCVCSEEEYTYDQIARQMNVHRRTVDNYRESLFGKFNIKSKTGLVLLAIRHNLIDV
jgi:DNA-binding NarL/FixJ family response regulator